MASVRYIAEQAGVSIATVSRALNNDNGISPSTRKKVLAVARSAGYNLAAGRRSATNIGFAYTGEQTISHPFDSAVLEGVVDSLGESGANIVVLNIKRSKARDESYTQFFARCGVRGVVLRVMAETRDVCRAIAGEGFPHVVISERFDAPEINCVDCESRTDSVRAVEYLIALGHQRIAFAAHNIPDRDHMDRLDGYRTALERHDVPFDPKLVFHHPASLAGGATVLKMIMSMSDRPTAVYFADWMLAVGGVKAAHELGVQIPGELSVIGFDDTNMREAVHPRLTAVCQDAMQLGLEAGARLAQYLADKNPKPFQAGIPSFFEINESTAPPGGQLIRIASKDQQAVAAGGTGANETEAPLS